MFEEDAKKTVSTAPVVQSAGQGNASLVIHTMPKEFFDRSRAVKDKEKIVATPIVAPPVVKNAPPTASVKSPVIVPPRHKKRSTAWLFVFLSLLLVGGVAVAAYIVIEQPFAPPVVQPTPEPEPQPEPEPEPAVPVPGTDTDSDGLTNIEELLYGTDFRNPDSDGDTFLDGNEVFHRYDPLGVAPSTLLDTGAVRVLQSDSLPFEIYYPTTWNPVSTPEAQRVSFRSSSAQLVVLEWQAKDPALNLEAWYRENVSAFGVDRLTSTYTKEGYYSLIGADDRSMYLDTGNAVYIAHYELGDSATVDYLQTFKMMVNSFKLLP